MSLPVPGELLQRWPELVPQWLTALTGAVLLLAGGRVYRFAVLTPGVVAGALLAAALPTELDGALRASAALVLAATGAVLCHLLERVAVHAIGALCAAGLANAVWPSLGGTSAPWWGLLVGALLGAFLFPKLFKKLLSFLTALLGALLLAWSLGQAQNIWLLGGLFLGGCVLQLALAGGGGKKKKE